MKETCTNTCSNYKTLTLTLTLNEGNMYKHMLELQNINPNLNPKWRKHVQTHAQITKH
jgi:hypothetical protein